MAEKRGAVAFDFDGVIGDSVKECFVQSMAAHSAIGSRLRQNAELEKKFFQARPFVKVAADYGVVLSMIEANSSIDFRKIPVRVFEEAKKRFSKGKEFEAAFYAARKKMLAENPALFNRLQAQFKGIAYVIKRARKYHQVAIASTKDANAVSVLLKQYGISIPAENIISKEFHTDKAEQLKEISRRLGVPTSKIVLIDDIPEQLERAKAVGARRILAGWGYNTPKQRRTARKQRIPVARKPDKNLVRKIKRALR